MLADRWERDEDEENVQPRAGVLLNYSPSRILYVSEAVTHSIAVIRLSDDGMVFHVVSVNRLYSPALNRPIDITLVEMETRDPNWASNTILDVQSDFYVANRGDNTIVRMRQDGSVVSRRRIRFMGGKPLDEMRLNGIATSPDGNRIWVTLSGPVTGMNDLKGAVLELPAF